MKSVFLYIIDTQHQGLKITKTLLLLSAALCWSDRARSIIGKVLPVQWGSENIAGIYVVCFPLYGLWFLKPLTGWTVHPEKWRHYPMKVSGFVTAFDLLLAHKRSGFCHSHLKRH